MSFFDNLLGESQELLRRSCRRFAEKHIAPHADEWEEAGGFPLSLYKVAAEAGVLGIGFDESIGGAGGGPTHVVAAIEGLMRGRSTGVAVGLGSLGIALPALVQSGDEGLIERFVRPVLAGERVSALAITEPGTGSDVAAVRTRAELRGDHYVVNGAKLFITSGVRAEVLTTLVRTSDDPHGGLTFLVVERGPGVTVSRALKKTGWWASDTAELAFDDVRVPVENRVGSEGSGFHVLMRNFQTERLALAAYGVATAEMALEESVRYSKQRAAFGRPLVGFQVTRHKLAEMATQVTLAKTLVYQVARRMEDGEVCIKEVSIAKNVAAEVAMSVTYQAVQLHGGMGYMRETLVERLSRDARLLPIGGGTQEIMNEIIAKSMGL
ncbi:MAG: acyl-CoA dehydrogenase [Deltaproteobacteria bacterium CG2_30_63_29]|nr:MAG: acyl-CoA dehydrogenase [Deltaproteobacteria bacterium CG2_30_63_29]PJB46260.1 MAG: acyl-CoA dehydrogenase [Deltaproteobacteria bacterium CG_4_9_14_3_um_filter_63_12]